MSDLEPIDLGNRPKPQLPWFKYDGPVLTVLILGLLITWFIWAFSPGDNPFGTGALMAIFAAGISVTVTGVIWFVLGRSQKLAPIILGVVLAALNVLSGIRVMQQRRNASRNAAIKDEFDELQAKMKELELREAMGENVQQERIELVNSANERMHRMAAGDRSLKALATVMDPVNRSVKQAMVLEKEYVDICGGDASSPPTSWENLERRLAAKEKLLKAYDDVIALMDECEDKFREAMRKSGDSDSTIAIAMAQITPKFRASFAATKAKREAYAVSRKYHVFLRENFGKWQYNAETKKIGFMQDDLLAEANKLVAEYARAMAKIDEAQAEYKRLLDEKRK